MKKVPDSKKFTVARDQSKYLAFTGVAQVNDRLVCCYLRSDQHCRTTSDVMVAVSEDGGSTWKDHRVLAHADCENDGAIWVSPEINALRDGRMAIICDRGIRPPGVQQPNLHRWQKSPLGMENHVFWSDDAGLSWSEPVKIDDWGGEPERIIELADGSLAFTRTESSELREDQEPYRSRIKPPDWLSWFSSTGYYACAFVVSEDGGKTWHRRSMLSDDPLWSDAEVGITETSPGNILAVTRCGNLNGAFGQPSRFFRSQNGGRTWGAPKLAPFYGQRPIPGMLLSGKVLVTFRNRWGTPGTAACIIDPEEELGFEPSAFIWDESRCVLSDGAMKIESEEGNTGAVEFSLYPAEDNRARVEVETELRVEEADANGCCICAGYWVVFQNDGLYLTPEFHLNKAHNRSEAAPDSGSIPGHFIALDTSQFHFYRFVRENGGAAIHVDGELKLQVPLDAEHATRFVHFGNRATGGGSRQYSRNRSLSYWKSLRAKVENELDHSIEWNWDAASGVYPDQFRRDRIVFLDLNGSFVFGNSGYSGWTQLSDGRIVVCDYTFGEQIVREGADINSNYEHEKQTAFPFIRAYVVTEEDLI